MRLDKLTGSVVAGLVMVAGAGTAAATEDPQPRPEHAGGHDKTAVATLRNLDGDRIGMVRLSSRADQTRIRAKTWGLEPGFHGFHVHTVGICDPATDFTSAEGHFNPTGDDHGNHAGDMPPLLVNDDGSARLAFSTDRFTVSDLRDSDGSAVMVHQDRDNFANIPERYRSTTEGGRGPDSETLDTGDAGSRLACGKVH